MASSGNNPMAASQPKMSVSSKASPAKSVASKEVMSKDEFDQRQTKSVCALITLDLGLSPDSMDTLAVILSDRESPETNRSMFAVDDSYNHESVPVVKVEEDKLTELSQQITLPALVGISDFDQSTSGSIIVFRLPSRKNPSGLSCFTFRAANLFQNTDSYYAGELLPNKVVARKVVGFTHNCFSSEDMECLDTTKGSFSIVIRSNRRAVNTLIADIVTKLPSVTLACGIELYRYEKTAKNKAANSMLRNLNNSDFSSPTSSSSSSTATDARKMAAVGLLDGPSVKVGAGDKNDDDDDDVDDDHDDENDDVEGAVPLVGGVQADANAVAVESAASKIGSDHKIVGTAAAITLPIEDTERVQVSISVSCMKLLALHIISFNTTEDPKVIFITNKDHLVVFTGVFMSISGNPLVPLTMKFEHNESIKT